MYITFRAFVMEQQCSNLIVPCLLSLTSLLLTTSRAHTNHHLTTEPRHPLDPLAVKEINLVRTILSSYGGNKSFIVYSMTLEEPPKSSVLAWKQGDPLFPRKASVIACFRGGPILILTVNLKFDKVEKVETNPYSGYPYPTMKEFDDALIAPFTSAEFNKSILDRGLDFADVVCKQLGPGWFGEEEEKRRLVKVQCMSKEGTINVYLKPIEGLTMIIDLDTNQVVDISDHGKHIPIPSAIDTDYRFTAQKRTHQKIRPINPIYMQQPKGPSFTVNNGHLIKWANWEFHLKADPRAGLIISQAKFQDPNTEEMRSVMYKGMISELFVPYMDPTKSWYFKTYMDAGEYGFGLSTRSLDPINDCPRNAYYLDGVFITSDGKPFINSNMICVFERYGSDIAWRHTETIVPGNKVREVRPKVTLVVRMVASVGNYDYVSDWIFQSDGLIKVEIGLSGIPNVKSTKYENMKEVPEQEDLYGTLVFENAIGVFHDHYVAFYLDMDVDGPNNSFVKVHLQRENTSLGKSPRKSYLKAIRNVAKTEKDAQIKFNLYKPIEYHIINPNKKSLIGNPIGYSVIPSAIVTNLLDLEDPAQKRAAFTNNQIWITPYNQREVWAGGLFVWQSHGDDTLATWSNRDRPIENKDIVLWYVLGIHHIPCQEDFPIMPMVTQTFVLKPTNFFSRNPILETPPYFEEDLPTCQAMRRDFV